MSYSVKEQTNTETKETEYIVIDSKGAMASAPFGGPFFSKEVALTACALLTQLTIEAWLAVHSMNNKAEKIEGTGKVLYVAPDKRWIQSKGRDIFAVHEPAECELEIGEMVEVDKSGEIKLLDREPRSLGMRL